MKTTASHGELDPHPRNSGCHEEGTSAGKALKESPDQVVALLSDMAISGFLLQPRAPGGGGFQFPVLRSLGGHLITKESQGRNSRQESRSRNWSRSHGGVLLTGLLTMASSAAFLNHLGHLAVTIHTG